MAEWQIEPAVVGKHRASVLLAPTTFEEILCRLRGRDAPPGPRWKVGEVGGRFEGARRALWTITPSDKEAIDLFFNGRGGYRAAYSLSVRCGEDANDMALRFLSSWLRDFTGAAISDSSVPLLGSGAKLWIPEDERINCALIAGRRYMPEVLVPAWLHAAELQVVVSTSEGDRYKAAAGILAPLPTSLRVIGTWIHDGRIVAGVKERGREIHLYGYT